MYFDDLQLKVAQIMVYLFQPIRLLDLHHMICTQHYAEDEDINVQHDDTTTFMIQQLKDDEMWLFAFQPIRSLDLHHMTLLQQTP